MRLQKLSVVAVASILVLAGCAADAPEPDPEELTVTEAGARYLAAICPVNSAWDAVDVEVDRLRVELARGEAGSTDPIGSALTKLERKTVAALELLDDATVAWPVAAQDPIAAVRDTLTTDAEQAATVAELSGRDLVAYSWDGAGAISSAAAEARAALGLPEDPAAACDAR